MARAVSPPPPAGVDPLRTRHWWAIFAAGCVVLGLLLGAQFYIGGLLHERPRAIGEVARIAMVDAGSWALLALLAFWLARRVPLERGGLLRFIAIQGTVAVAVVLARIEALDVLGGYLWGGRRAAVPLLDRVVVLVPSNLLVYLLFVGMGCALEYLRRARAGEVAAARLEMEVAHAQLQVLTNHLQPSFLFASLRTLSRLMRHDTAAADRMLALLGDLLRASLQMAAREEVPLREELEFMEMYLEIEQARLGERLQLVWQVAPEVQDARVPHLILQPLVAAGLGDDSAACAPWIAVRANRTADALELEVDARAGSEPDSGAMPGFPSSALAAAARPRLAAIYGGIYDVEVDEHAAGVRMRLVLPWRHAEVAAASEADAAAPASIS